ncbi:exonuclease RecJ [Halorubrum vacuolatum]|uniref:Exonuclease RecJ n=1 Tax=Halorubrum vacuolatum TaxID=63740 RepID=A0A238WHX3_HALVU|nr:exonuclease RecJ [Halorubrum vacuolatum]SNR46152.1 hypothetical protein SAMN06264855_10819 [Halorubrum vacuolatum]
MTETTTVDTPAPDALAAVLLDAPFVRLVATNDGDALAATGLLARALRERGVPFQARVSADPTPETTGDDVGVSVGTPAAGGAYTVSGAGQPASVSAHAIARALGNDPDPVVTLAGVVAAGSVPGVDGSADVLEAAVEEGLIERRPGVAVPTADLPQGLAASTLLRASWSGDLEATRATLVALDLPTELDADAHRRLASLVAIDVAAAPEASPNAPEAVAHALGPYAITDGRPAATVGGLADVLDLLAREAPGTGIALLLAEGAGDPTWSAALDAWQAHGMAAHRALDAATTARYDGCFVVRVDATGAVLPTVARLACAFQSPEPVVVAVDETGGRLAVEATEPLGVGDACRAAAAEVGGTGWGLPTRGGIEIETAAPDATVSGALAALRGSV